jgi:hydrogenase nickel incorporation protein HypA/HybF
MHEIGIVENIINTAQQACIQQGYNKIKSIRLKLGKASGVTKDSLIFSFNALKNNVLSEEALLIIDEINVKGTCEDCRQPFTTDDSYMLLCPLCGSASIQITEGKELEIVHLDVE